MALLFVPDTIVTERQFTGSELIKKNLLLGMVKGVNSILGI